MSPTIAPRLPRSRFQAATPGRGRGGIQTPAVPLSLWVKETEIQIQWLEFGGIIPARTELLRGEAGKGREHEIGSGDLQGHPLSVGWVKSTGLGKNHWEW